MTGPQLRTWRQSQNLTLRELAAQLGGVTHTTISRWESAPAAIPAWVTERLLNHTEVQLPLTALDALLDIAREDGTKFHEVLAQAIREYLQRRKEKKQQATTKHATSDKVHKLPQGMSMQDLHRAAEDAPAYEPKPRLRRSVP